MLNFVVNNHVILFKLGMEVLIKDGYNNLFLHNNIGYWLFLPTNTITILLKTNDLIVFVSS